jgi:16S rRNA (uracil1498-N3)-methyltransferase
MHRFYVPPEQSSASTFLLEDREAHHAAVVLRLRAGENVTVLDGAGHRIECEVQNAGKKSVSLLAKKREYIPPLPFQTTLIQAIPKGKTMEWIIEKATELGCSRVVPLLTERVAVQIPADALEDKRDKWQQVAIEAVKQCGQPWLPQIGTPVRLPALLTTPRDFDLSLIGSLKEGAVHPRRVLDDFVRSRGHAPKKVAVWIGPEGDFAPGELEKIIAAGAIGINLGPLILRCETAAIYSLSFLNYELSSAAKE